MLQIIGVLILLVIGFVILKALFRASFNILGVVLGLGVLIVAGPPLLAGYIVERITLRAAGSLLGGMIATAISKKIASALVEDDRVKVLTLIQEQVTWLATSFILTEHELENLNANLAAVLDPKTLEIIFAAKEQGRATANMLINWRLQRRFLLLHDRNNIGTNF